jgi:hypothetical protein
MSDEGMKLFLRACSRVSEEYRVGENGKYQCQCCGNFTLAGQHDYLICPVCFWEDEGITDPEEWSGANGDNLRGARQTFLSIGSCKAEMLRHCRLATEEEKIPLDNRSGAVQRLES